MRHWLTKTKPSRERATEGQVVEVFDEMFNPNNDAPVRVRSVKEFVVGIIEESQQKDSEIAELKGQLDALESTKEELGVARLALEQADLRREKLKEEIDRLQKKVNEQKEKNQKLRDENNDLKLKMMVRKTRAKQSKKEKK